MLTSLRVKNFRLFSDLTLPRLGRVNLVVGKNNSGKTCLLEAVRVYAEEGAFPLLKQLVIDRHEDIDALADQDRRDTGEAYADHFRSLFHGYRFPTRLEDRIEIGPVPVESGSPLPNLLIGLGAYVKGDPATGAIRQRIDVPTGEDVPEEADLFLERRLVRGPGEVEITSFPLGAWSRPTRRMMGEQPPPRSRFVGAKAFNEDSQETVADQWARVSVRPSQRERVLEALRLIDPAIREVVMIPGPRRHSEPVVIYSDDFRLPLRSLGDGIGRIFQMALATVVERSGTVLFDEFENGLHWSVQPLAWALIFKLATELDLQVVATTHSWDCIDAFQQAGRAGDPDSAMLFHLGRSVRKSTENQVVVATYTGEELHRATKAHLEIR